MMYKYSERKRRIVGRTSRQWDIHFTCGAVHIHVGRTPNIVHHIGPSMIFAKYNLRRRSSTYVPQVEFTSHAYFIYAVQDTTEIHFFSK